MTATALTLTSALAVPGQSIENYVQALKTIPMLSAEEEKRLAERLSTNNDVEAARTLILSHLRFVAHIAHGYRGYGLPHADLIQEGNIGLMKAVKRFDPTVGVRLVSFAVHWIRAEIHEYILRNWRIVKVATTKSQRKLFFNLRSAKKKLDWMSADEARNMANELGVPMKDVLEMEMRLNAMDAPFDGSAKEEGEDTPAPSGYLQDSRFDPARLAEEADCEQHDLHRLQDALATLDERSRDILQQRWLDSKKATLHELAERYRVSAERIRQIEANAMLKLKKKLMAA